MINMFKDKNIANIFITNITHKYTYKMFSCHTLVQFFRFCPTNVFVCAPALLRHIVPASQIKSHTSLSGRPRLPEL